MNDMFGFEKYSPWSLGFKIRVTILHRGATMSATKSRRQSMHGSIP